MKKFTIVKIYIMKQVTEDVKRLFQIGLICYLRFVHLQTRRKADFRSQFKDEYLFLESLVNKTIRKKAIKFVSLNHI